MRRLADVLWEANCQYPDMEAGDTALSRAWRTHGYGRIEHACRSRIQRHGNPEPWLSMKCGLQFLAGHGWERQGRRYESVVGGAVTEQEYRLLVGQALELPILLVGGFPRSGTTTLQTAVRAAYPEHIPEIHTEAERFSLWDYPKHTPLVFHTVAQMRESTVIGLVTVRPFVDAAASLVVGRGGSDRVDVHEELARWESWLPIYNSPVIRVIPFEAITAMSPQQLIDTIAELTGVETSREVRAGAGFADLMRSFGKGDPDHPRQSNLPSSERVADLRAARRWVETQLGRRECARVAALYDEVPSSVTGRDDPRVVASDLPAPMASTLFAT